MTDTPSEKMQAKAAELLLKGRVRVRSVVKDVPQTVKEGLQYAFFRADVYSMTQDGDPYRVSYKTHWLCDCPARVPVCAHIVACQAVYEPAKPELDPEVEALDIDALLGNL